MSDDHEQKFEDFFRKHDRRFRRWLARKGASPELVEEIALRAFLAVFRHWERLRAGFPPAYLYTIGKNELRTPRKKRLHELSLDDSDVDVAERSDHVERMIDRNHLWGLVRRLPRSLRQAITLRYAEKFSVAETAATMGVTPGAVKRYDWEARRALKKMIVDGEREEATDR
jgi:RNA polymerase sigma factor (sigma-70 family)